MGLKHNVNNRVPADSQSYSVINSCIIVGCWFVECIFKIMCLLTTLTNYQIQSTNRAQSQLLLGTFPEKTRSYGCSCTFISALTIL